MKHSSTSYRLQLIKDIATRKQTKHKGADPMAHYIEQILADPQNSSDKTKEAKRNFNGTHFDEQAGGWVSDRWSGK